MMNMFQLSGYILLGICVVLAQGQETTDKEPSSAPEETTAPPTTEAPTSKPVVTTKAPTPTTQQKTTQPPSTAPPKPTPAPAKKGDWRVNATVQGKDDFTCIHMSGEITFYVLNNKTHKHRTIAVPGPEAAVDRDASSCHANGTTGITEGHEEDLALEFDKDGEKYEATFTFSNNKNDTKISKRYKLIKICLNGGGVNQCGSLEGVMANEDMSYVCSPFQNYTLVSEKKSETTVAVSFKGIQLQAFLNNAPSFGQQYQCEAMRSNDLVPIIVGSCLAALVVIVLIAYLIGRSRAKGSTGYESV